MGQKVSEVCQDSTCAGEDLCALFPCPDIDTDHANATSTSTSTEQDIRPRCNIEVVELVDQEALADSEDIAAAAGSGGGYRKITVEKFKEEFVKLNRPVVFRGLLTELLGK